MVEVYPCEEPGCDSWFLKPEALAGHQVAHLDPDDWGARRPPP